MSRTSLVWGLPIMACIVAGIVALIPADNAISGRFLPYEALVPWAPISSIGIWITGFLLYLLARESKPRAT